MRRINNDIENIVINDVNDLETVVGGDFPIGLRQTVKIAFKNDSYTKNEAMKIINKAAKELVDLFIDYSTEKIAAFSYNSVQDSVRVMCEVLDEATEEICKYK